uniref:Calponin-homology (CH) domain-containing protein n=1 Tax=Timema monikensis TaxID=170555 RepID=A0A7R9EHF2_9NEOP|nr:unnamed protein product [Timema monikensis]
MAPYKHVINQASNVDIVNGNLKLILGLIWSLIMRYQIGRSKFPPKKLMMAWLKAVLPECRVGNLTTDWNSGVNLSALLEYCQPGLFPHWRTLDPGDRGLDNSCSMSCYWSQGTGQLVFNVMLLESGDWTTRVQCHVTRDWTTRVQCHVTGVGGLDNSCSMSCY